ncbi:hypothetical protein [Actinokineospora diospyrosa]|uniref:Uncharacterized protein n=1 Tax=Actinokineospora diospyrosa TaxID=103728 RepID=A0ABT1IBY1_9PSEU|nr:hypothetical protein [Actinokineospora diospyrosa]MCP2269866.1 hypothetical protein [Actinokineospora diospyrosa]
MGDRGRVFTWIASLALIAAVVALTSCAAEAQPEISLGETSAGVGSGASSKPADLPVVHDGDEVVATGFVLAEPGKPSRFCAPAPMSGVDTDRCRFNVPITGVDGKDLPDPVTLRGTWRAGTFEVIRQEPAPPASTPPDPAVPCPAPGGGWLTNNDADTKDLHRYVVDEHPEDFRQPWIAWPNGFPSGNVPTEDVARQARVMVVEVVHGELADVRKALESRYTGNLCVVAAGAGLSIADQAHVRDATEKAIEPFLNDPAFGIYATSAADKLTVDLVVLTPELVSGFSSLPMALVEFDPWVRPA